MWLVTLVSPLSPMLLLGMLIPYFGDFPWFSLQAQFCSSASLALSQGFFSISGAILDQVQAAGAQGLWAAGLGPVSSTIFGMFIKS